MSQTRKKVMNIDFDMFVDIFNTQGKTAAVKHVTDTYDVKYETIVKRLRRDSKYIFDQSRDRYVLKPEHRLESQFLSVDELCKNNKSANIESNNVDKNEVINMLIKDKFFELSKFVILESSSNSIWIKVNDARNAGYHIKYVLYYTPKGRQK